MAPPRKQSTARSRKAASGRAQARTKPAREAKTGTTRRVNKAVPARRASEPGRVALPPIWPLTRTGFWLMKTEPELFSIDMLASMGRSPWDGVRSFQARNLIRSMQVGDLALFYHSSTKPPGVVGLARVVRDPYPDHTQFDPTSKYFDPSAKPHDPRWSMVDVEFVEKFARAFTLEELKADPALATMLVVRRGMRLSVQPVSADHMRHILLHCGSASAPAV